jgi:peptide chain release factor 1
MDVVPYIARFRKRFTEVEIELTRPDLFDDPKKAQTLTREHARLKENLGHCDAYEKLTKQLADAQLLAKSQDPEFVEMAQAEIAELMPQLEKTTQALTLAIIPPDETDSRNTIVEIRAGVGGSESALFAADLFRLYSRYAERLGWSADVMDASPADLGGYREIIFQVNGTDVYKHLRFESGVHRVQRVPATEAQGRIHTSTATVAVLPEAQEVDLVIKPDDLRIDVCRAGGHGGQGVNTTDSAVQILHIPTGMIVKCQDGRSQLKNKEKAMGVLRSRLLQRKQDEEEAKYAAERKSQVGKGDRNEKIRTYNYPQNRVTDHRIQYSVNNLPGFMDGDIEEILDQLMLNAVNEKLAALEPPTS